MHKYYGRCYSISIIKPVTGISLATEADADADQRAANTANWPQRCQSPVFHYQPSLQISPHEYAYFIVQRDINAL